MAEVFGSIHCFSCDFLALPHHMPQPLVLCLALPQTSHFQHSIHELATEAALNHVLFLLKLLVPFYTVFVTKILALADDVGRQLALNLIPGSQHVLYLDRCIFGTLSSLKHI